MTDITKAVELLVTLAVAKDEDEREKVLDQLRDIMLEDEPMVRVTPRELAEIVITELGVPCHLRGYDYIVTGVCLMVENPGVRYRITKELYPAIAKAHKTTGSRVERAIRHAVETSWVRADVQVLHSYFGNSCDVERGKPVNGQFLWCVAREVQRRGGFYEMG